MKLNRLIALTILTTLTLTNTLFALSPEEKVHFQTKNKAMIEKVLEANKPVPVTQPNKVNFKDAYGNLLTVDIKAPWGPKGNQFTPNGAEKIWITKPGYKRQDFVTKPGESTVVLAPEKATQVFMGSLQLPEGTPKTDWWIALRDTTAKDYEDPAFTLKVKEDGTFKALNVPKGNYNVEIYQGKNNIYYPDNKGNTGIKRVTEKTLEYPTTKLEVKGNVDKVFDYSEIVLTTQVTIEDYFNEIDYSDPSKFLEITKHTELTEDMKKVADKFNDKKDLSTVREIFVYMRSLAPNKPKNAVNDMSLTAEEIFKQGYATGCTQFGTLFQAFAKYKGIPNVFVSSLSTKWSVDMQNNIDESTVGHVFVEAFIDNKWVLINSTNGDYYTDYDKDNFIIKSASSPYKDDLLYVMIKGNDYTVHATNWVDVQKELGKAFDLTTLEITTPNKVSGHLER